MRGAPHSGFSRPIRRINTRTSWGTCGRPRCRRRDFHERKAHSVPANDGVRLDDDDDVQAARPQTIEPDPEEPVDPGQPGPGRPLALEHRNLMAKGNEFELQRGPVSKARKEGGEQQRENRRHPPILSASISNRRVSAPDGINGRDRPTRATHRPLPRSWHRCGRRTGSSTPSRPSPDPRRCSPISAATPTASRSPTAG